MAIFNLIFFVTSIAISQRARPIGGLRYRWGAYLGMWAGWISLWMIVSSFYEIRAGHPWGAFVLSLVAALVAATCAGILQKKRLGAISLALAYIVIFFVIPFFYIPASSQSFILNTSTTPLSLAEGMGNSLASFASLALFLKIALLAITFVYFRQRWNLMRGQPTSPPRTPYTVPAA